MSILKVFIFVSFYDNKWKSAKATISLYTMAHLNECHSFFVWSIWWDSLSADCRIPLFLPKKSHCLYDRVGAIRSMLSSFRWQLLCLVDCCLHSLLSTSSHQIIVALLRTTLGGLLHEKFVTMSLPEVDCCVWWYYVCAEYKISHLQQY